VFEESRFLWRGFSPGRLKVPDALISMNLTTVSLALAAIAASSSLIDQRLYERDQHPRPPLCRCPVQCGIDLVFKHKNGQTWAVQAKCYSPSYEITKPDVDKFLSESNRKEIDHRLLIATTDRLGANAKAPRSLSVRSGGDDPHAKVVLRRCLRHCVLRVTLQSKRRMAAACPGTLQTRLHWGQGSAENPSRSAPERRRLVPQCRMRLPGTKLRDRGEQSQADSAKDIALPQQGSMRS
jgi:hypothetical protein